MKKILLSFLLITGIAGTGYAQIFSQNFNSSAVVTDYVGTAANLFTSITGGANNVASINNNALRFTKVGANSGYFARTQDLNSQILKVAFSITVSSQAAGNNNQATFYTGQSLGDNATAPSVANTHSKFAINFDALAGSFSVRDLNTSTNSNVYAGTQTITFIVNNRTDGLAITYIAPNGSSEQLANDKWDLWIGNNKEFDERVLGTSGTSTIVGLPNFKFIYPSASTNAIIDFDNFVINNETDPTTLPVSLTSFTAKPTLQDIDLAWNTASEKDNSHFDILRSGDGRTFAKIGEVKGAGTTAIAKNYAFTDKNALPGVSYYQLKQVDNDGKPTLSSIEAVKSNVAASNFKVAANKQDGTVKLTVYAAGASKATFKVYDLNGRKLTEKELTLDKGYTNFSVPFNGANGLHVASLTIGTETVTQKFIQ